MKFKHLIDDIVIDLWFSSSFASMKYTIREFNPIVDFLKFTFSQKILNGVIGEANSPKC